MGIAHGMVNHQVRKVITNAMLTAFGHTLEHQWIHAFVLRHNSRTHRSQNRLARQTHVHASQIFLVIKATRHLAHHDRVITALRHILFTRPN